MAKRNLPARPGSMPITTTRNGEIWGVAEVRRLLEISRSVLDADVTQVEDAITHVIKIHGYGFEARLAGRQALREVARTYLQHGEDEEVVGAMLAQTYSDMDRDVRGFVDQVIDKLGDQMRRPLYPDEKRAAQPKGFKEVWNEWW
jgi:hypothetical protein